MADCETVIAEVYKDHAARILSALVRVFGPRHLSLAEDVLQEAFGRALVAWQSGRVPNNPAGWILAAAKNRAIDVIRAQRTHKKFSEDLTHHLQSDWTLSYTVDQEFQESRIKDHQLRMIFMCTSAELAPENRLPLMLRTLCGFGIPAIARALFLSEGTVKKRLVRTRERLRGYRFEFPPEEALPHKMDTVHTVLYLLFNEGFHSSDDAMAMNLELCREAIYLTNLIVEQPRIANRDTLGLLALMQFHLARSASRVDAQGVNVPIDRQDRSLWDRAAITSACNLIRLSDALPPGASGRFSIEARLAEEHCTAAEFERTDWNAILGLYDELVAATGSPVAALNRAVALGYTGELTEARRLVLQLQQHPLLGKSHLPAATLAHLSAKLGDAEAARRYASEAQKLGGTSHEHRVMYTQLERLLERAR